MSPVTAGIAPDLQATRGSIVLERGGARKRRAWGLGSVRGRIWAGSSLDPSALYPVSMSRAWLHAPAFIRSLPPRAPLASHIHDCDFMPSSFGGVWSVVSRVSGRYMLAPIKDHERSHRERAGDHRHVMFVWWRCCPRGLFGVVWGCRRYTTRPRFDMDVINGPLQATYMGRLGQQAPLPTKTLRFRKSGAVGRGFRSSDRFLLSRVCS